MRGYPPLQLLLVILGFALLAVPLYKLTGKAMASPENKADSHESTEQTPQIKAAIQVRCAHAPEKLELLTSKGSLIIWEKEKNWPQTVSLKMDPGKPLEIAISAVWPADVSSTAVTVEYIPESRPSETQTLWSIDAEMEDVFIFNSNTPKS